MYVGAVVRFGLLTTAAINGAILGARADDAPFEIVAVGSRDAARAEAYAREHGIERAHASYEALLADEGVDAVYIALPNALHHEWTMRALRAGKHVLVEKPYTRIPEQVDEAWDEAERGGLVLEEAYMWRHSRQTQLILDLLPQVGEVRGAHATFTAMLTRDDDPRWVPELGGGALLDVGVYTVAFAAMVFGPQPKRIVGMAHLGETGVDEQSACLLGYDRGQLAVLTSAVRTVTPHEARIDGTDGSIAIPTFWRGAKAVLTAAGRTETVEMPLAGNGYNYEAVEVGRCLREQRLESAAIPLDESLAIMRTMDELRRQFGLRYPADAKPAKGSAI